MKNMPYGNEGYESQEQRLLDRTPTPGKILLNQDLLILYR